MDDDVPLSALAKPLKLDDDTPLASLADIGKPRANPKVGSKTGGGSPAGKLNPKGSPKSAGPPKGAGKGKRKSGGSSSSSSSSETEDSSESESDDKPKPPRRKGSTTSVGKKAKLKLLQQDAEEIPEDGGGAVQKRNRSQKEQVVADLLCRWWYALPDWPPEDEDFYQGELAKKSLRKVAIEEWEWVDEEDSNGRKKVYELTQFKGLFRASDGSLVDLRPRETCPCYANFIKKDLNELYDILILAFENQLKDLKNSSFNEAQFEQELKTRLTKVRDAAYKAKEGGLKRRKSG